MTTSSSLRETLCRLSKKQVDILLNDNRTTMISILEQKKKYVRISLHRMFLNATNPVIEALVGLIQNQREPRHSTLLRGYINEHLHFFTNDKKCDPKKWVSQGKIYDLNHLYNELNSSYFENRLNLNITWYGEATKRRGSQMTYGLYDESLKLIKIHRLLDRENCPEFYITYVIYHEMLHEVHRPQMRSQRNCIHTPEFKTEEKKFQYYQEAKDWEKKSRHLFFK